jgi:hypothetical protein
MIKSCSIIYLPGSGGNFIKLCLSLSKETVPYYNINLHELSTKQIHAIRAMQATQRINFLKIDSIENFDRIHLAKNTTQPLFDPDFYYSNSLINDYFEWALVSNHPDNYHDRLSYLQKIICVDINLDTYTNWTRKAKNYFKKFGYTANFTCNLEKQMQHVEVIKKLPICMTLDMNAILESEQGFKDQYLLACKDLGITPEFDHAITLYRGWRKFRVDPFLFDIPQEYSNL